MIVAVTTHLSWLDFLLIFLLDLVAIAIILKALRP
jgi:hypothetical protein